MALSLVMFHEIEKKG